MKAKAPNYLYPLATTRQLQWTKDVVKGEKSAKKAITPKRFDARKKKVIQDAVRSSNKNLTKKRSRTRTTFNPMLKSHDLPADPMLAPDPRPGNAMHITNSKTAYNGGYQN
jgi:hypothetical protein